MANIGTFGDEFPGTSLSGSWTAFNSGSPTVGGGLLALGTETVPLNGVRTTSTFTWQGSKIRGRFDAAAAGSGTLRATWVGPFLGASSSTTVFAVAGAFGNQAALYTVSINGGYVSGPVASSAANHVWWELDFTGADMVFRTSADGTSWTDRHTATGTNGSAYNGANLFVAGSNNSGSSNIDAIIATESAGGRFRPYFITG